jgi:hypothetical protein
MAGAISGVPRLPGSSSKSRINRFNAGVGFKDPDQVRIQGRMTSPVVSPATMPANPEDGETVLLYDSTGPEVSIAIHYGGLWYKAVATAIT